MKKLLKVFGTLSLLSVVVAGCETPTDSSSVDTPTSSDKGTTDENSSTSQDSSSSNSEDSSASSDNQNEDSSSTSDPIVEKYAVVILDSGMSQVSVSTGNEKVPAGEVVDLTVTPIDGYKVEKVTMNDKEIEPTSVNNYSFVMPNTSARIKVITTLENKDGIIVNGGVSARLTDEDGDGIYVARNIPVQQDTNIYYTTGESSEPLGMIYIDNAKSFANISLGGTKEGFMIGGNAIYDFYFDSNDNSTPIYIQRVGIINLPTNESSFAALFAGEAKSSSTLYPSNVNNVKYSSTKKNEKYEWNLYSDNSSYAKVTSLLTNREKAVVYKAQTSENVYKVVDSYTEGASYPTYVTRGDTTAYSGQYDIVATKSAAKYQYTQDEVDFDANMYSHTMEALDAEFYDAYRNGYVGNIYNDQAVDHDAEVVSTRLANDEFNVNLKTWVRWKDSVTYSESLGLKSAYITYEMDVTFTAGGAIKEGTYTKTVYTPTHYDFDTNRFKAGYEGVDPEEYVTFAYGYGQAKEGQPTEDVSKYFTQSITNVVLQSKTIADKTNTLSIGEEIKASVESAADGYSTNMTFVCEPVTALDQWQYGTISSSNQTVIAPRSITTPYELKAVGVGKANVTIGNHTKYSNTVTYDHELTVANAAYIKSVWMYPGKYLEGADYNDDTFYANSAYVEAGKVYKVQMTGTSTSGSYVYEGLGLSFECTKNAGLIDLYFDDKTGILTIDASKASVTENTTVSYTIVCPVQVEDWPQSKLSFTVVPGTDYTDSVVGSWTCMDTEVNAKVEFLTDTTGVVTVGSKEFEFTYTYDVASGDFKQVRVTSGISSSDNATLDMYIDPTDMALCVCFYVESIGEGWSSNLTEYIGYAPDYDYGYDGSWVPFTKD